MLAADSNLSIVPSHVPSLGPASMRTNDALEALRSAASQLNSRPAAPGSDCPRAGGSGEQPAAAERSNAQVLLQISCLHKAFLVSLPAC